jgi:hypothetical protein
MRGPKSAALKAGPDAAVDRVERWRIVDLCRVVEERCHIVYSEKGMLRLLWSLDQSHRKTRPVHPNSMRITSQRHSRTGANLGGQLTPHQRRTSRTSHKANGSHLRSLLDQVSIGS